MGPLRIGAMELVLQPITIGAGSKGAYWRLLEWLEQLTAKGKVLLGVCLVLPLAMFVAYEATSTTLFSCLDVFSHRCGMRPAA